jgi:hypothetical protein
MKHTFAYHIHNNNFVGDYILPLNKLQTIHPDIALKHSAKYSSSDHKDKYQNTDVQGVVAFDRETFHTPFFDSEKLFWGDVSFFTLHNPKLVFDLLDGLEVPHRKNIKAFKIPIERFSKNSMIWLYNHSAEVSIDPNDCIDIDSAIKIIDTSILPAKAIEYQVSMKNQGKGSLMYFYVPHILTTETVFVGDCEIISVS